MEFQRARKYVWLKSSKKKALLRCYLGRDFEEWQWILDTDTRKKGISYKQLSYVYSLNIQKYILCKIKSK